MPAASSPDRDRAEFTVHIDPEQLLNQQLSPAPSTSGAPPAAGRRTGSTGASRRGSTAARAGRPAPARSTRAYAFRRS